ncbi:hypothetical protein Tco_0001937 [Tanacetum coccineum]
MYCLGKDNGENIMKSTLQAGPYSLWEWSQMLLLRNFEVQFNKDIWENVEKDDSGGSELTKDDMELSVIRWNLNTSVKSKDEENHSRIPR